MRKLFTFAECNFVMWYCDDLCGESHAKFCCPLCKKENSYTCAEGDRVECDRCDAIFLVDDDDETLDFDPGNLFERAEAVYNSVETSPAPTLGNLIKDELSARRWSRKKFAGMIGCSEQSVGRILSGSILVGPITARAIADAFDLPIESINKRIAYEAKTK